MFDQPPSGLHQSLRCQSPGRGPTGVAIRWSQRGETKNGSSTKMAPKIERPTAIQIRCLPAEADSRVENNERRRSQIIGNARKNGAPTRTCHQLPETLSVTASQGDVSNAKGRNTTAPADNETSSAVALNHVGARPYSGGDTAQFLP
jgi:hypothetical protein